MKTYSQFINESVIDDFVKQNSDKYAVELDKETYKIFIKGDELIHWFVKHKIYTIQPGMFPLPSKPFKKTLLFSVFKILEK